MTDVQRWIGDNMCALPNYEGYPTSDDRDFVRYSDYKAMFDKLEAYRSNMEVAERTIKEQALKLDQALSAFHDRCRCIELQAEEMKALQSRLDNRDETIRLLELSVTELKSRLGEIREQCERYGLNQSADFYRTLLDNIGRIAWGEDVERQAHSCPHEIPDGEDCATCDNYGR